MSVYSFSGTYGNSPPLGLSEAETWKAGDPYHVTISTVSYSSIASGTDISWIYGTPSSGGALVTVRGYYSPRVYTLTEHAVTWVPPAPIFAYGPKGADVTISQFGNQASATSADAGVAFYKYGLEPVAGCVAYWEYSIQGTGGNDVGGFGVGSGWTEVDSQPGVSSNPGCMLYVVDGQWTICNNGVCSNVAGSGVPTYIGVGVTVVNSTTLNVKWYINGVDLGEEEVFTFTGPMWLPALYLSTTDYTFSLVEE